MEQKETYIPALHWHFLTKAYDFLLELTMPEKKFKGDMIESAEIKANDKVLDFGTGTATLSIMAHEQNKKADYTGIDIDDKVLKIAGEKVKKAGAKIRLENYNGGMMPFDDENFNVVISCLVFHHLSAEAKSKALQEIYRVLKPGGKLLITDFGKARNLYGKLAFGIFRRIDAGESSYINSKGLLPDYLRQAGFETASSINFYNTIFGTVESLYAEKPFYNN